MNSIRHYIDRKLVMQVKEKYFFDKDKVVVLRPGEVLLKQNQPNKRLFLVLSGLVAGYSNVDGESKQELFRAGENMFVGMHSFFSKSFKAFTDVEALEPTELTYIDAADFNAEDCNLTEDFVPILVSELYARQLVTKDIAQEKEAALKKLHQSDKMATLGQMAAGLAHELNNAIGVINGNSEWIAKEVHHYFKLNEKAVDLSLFERGFDQGKDTSSHDVRAVKRALEKHYKLLPSTAKKVARMGIEPQEIDAIVQNEEVDDLCEKMHQSWELGVALHDIIRTSKHAVHVLKSVKQLSAGDCERYELDVNDTLKEALTLLQNVVKKVEVDFKINELPSLVANHGELVQVWVNIIKNACESMLNANVTKPKLRLAACVKNNHMWVTCSDNGPGIPKDLQERIFQPNFTTKKGGLSFGLGLGLSIVQRLVESYGGKIEVKSKSRQTHFSIVFPMD